jgi:predicted MFS family arabinose efflux permease
LDAWFERQRAADARIAASAARSNGPPAAGVAPSVASLWPSSAGSTYAIVLITLIWAANYTDRQMLGLLIPPIKADLHLSDTSLGLVTGLGFVLLYSVLSVPVARVADRSNRRNILAAGLVVWSVMTCLTGLVTNVWELATTRFLLGAAEAAAIAPSISLVGDMVSGARRPLTLSLLTTGSGLSAILFIPLVAMLAQAYGWRAAFLAAGYAGLALAALLALTVKEPSRGAREARARSPVALAATARFLLGSRAYLFTVAGGAFAGVSLYATQVWHPAFLARVHHLDMAQIGWATGALRGIGSIAGAILGGLIAERLGRRDARWRLIVPGLACLLAWPAEVLFLMSPNLTLALAGMFGCHLFTAMHFGPVYAVCHSVARPGMSSTATAFFILVANVAGQAAGPLAIGLLNDRGAALFGAEAIRYSLLIGGASLPVAGALMMLGARSLGGDIRRAEP